MILSFQVNKTNLDNSSAVVSSVIENHLNIDDKKIFIRFIRQFFFSRSDNIVKNLNILLKF